MTSPIQKTTIFITHAAPEDNEFAVWLSSKLVLAGYNVWVDRQRLKGGEDFWDEIDQTLREVTVKQIVVFTKHANKQGVKKELAIGSIMKGRLNDPRFMIPIRADDTSFSDAPPEFIRGNILNAYPNWHDCLDELLAVFEKDKVPKDNSEEKEIIQKLVAIREEGKQVINAKPEQLLTNWFHVKLPEYIRYFAFSGTQLQSKTWLNDCKEPHVKYGIIVGTFCNPIDFLDSSSFQMNMPIRYEIKLEDYIQKRSMGPHLDWKPAANDLSNLLRQHFDQIAQERGLLPYKFSNGELGWFFPDNLVEDGKISFLSPDGRKIRRTLSGKFKTLRWHLCLVAKPRIKPLPIYRIHANLILSEDGKTPLPGDKTHKKRKRLTRSWWNNIWRDRLLAAMHYLSDGKNKIVLQNGMEISSWPIEIDFPFSYDTGDQNLVIEEDDSGNIVLNPDLDMVDEIEDVEEVA